MGLEIKRTTAKWGVINIREEGRGGDGKVEGDDIPFTINGGPELLDQVVAYDIDGQELSSVLFDKKDGRVLIPGAKLVSKHKKEGLSITVWDKPGAKAKPIILKEARIQEPKIELQSPNQVTLSSKIQIAELDDDTFIRFRRLRGEHADLEIIAEQTDMFDKDGDGEGEPAQ